MSRDEGGMTLCQDHWDMLRQEVVDQGLGEWIGKGSDLAVEQLVHQAQHGAQATNYDPLMASFFMIQGRLMGTPGGPGLGLRIFQVGCGLCYLNSNRDPETGFCKCSDPACPNKTVPIDPIEDFWIKGPNGPVAAARNYMIEQGWIPGEPS